MADVFCMEIDAQQISRYVKPGQFVTVSCGEKALLRRPFSVYRAVNGRIEILFQVIGSGTHWLATRRAGESIDILGPLGNGFEVAEGLHKLLLISGGIGVAPMIYLAQEAVANGYEVKMIMGAASASRLYPDSVEGVDLAKTTEDGSEGQKGCATDLLPQMVDWADQVFACGPTEMYRTMAEMVEIFEGKSVQILLERVMACGVGACRGCAVPTEAGIKMVCQDGPAFDLREIKWGDR
ncbi:MAG: dihydroorotate dehydrogenase electron transfer subunit [Dehalococcoidia bacterium]